ncbi:MAG TPA: alpha-L-arabinofuranosidase C-terminal domain-containing protein [Streptosporangiaceae bacterium]|nr:alpha-L-arabinofuranosidase C-terminal domain-containing protein [Streptosporangiaceae bacterium]
MPTSAPRTRAPVLPQDPSAGPCRGPERWSPPPRAGWPAADPNAGPVATCRLACRGPERRAPLFARNVGDKVLPVIATDTGLYYFATVDSRGGQVYLKIVNPASQGVATQIVFGGRNALAASIEVLADPDPQAGNTLAKPDAVVPSHGTLRGSSGTFTYQAPANSLTVIRVAR